MTFSRPSFRLRFRAGLDRAATCRAAPQFANTSATGGRLHRSRLLRLVMRIYPLCNADGYSVFALAGAIASFIPGECRKRPAHYPRDCDCPKSIDRFSSQGAGQKRG